MGGAEPPGATRSAAWREHGEDGEHRTFPGTSTVARFRWWGRACHAVSQGARFGPAGGRRAAPLGASIEAPWGGPQPLDGGVGTPPLHGSPPRVGAPFLAPQGRH